MIHMVRMSENYLGILPSLEVMPLFADRSDESGPIRDSLFRIKTYTSYGEIARHLLTSKLVASVIPLEIFVADVLGLPGQRNHWKIPVFISSCPTELVLSPSIYRALYPSQAEGQVKLPSRLIVGLQSQNSLTKSQFQEWIKQWKGSASIDVIYKMLPLDLRIRALEAGAVDAIIAPSPWGLFAESIEIGKCDIRFTPGKFAQQLALVCNKEFFESHRELACELPSMIASARHRLKQPNGFIKAAEKMSRTCRPALAIDLLEKAATLHGFESLGPDVAPDARDLTFALAQLAEHSILPAQVGAGENTARLLLCDPAAPNTRDMNRSRKTEPVVPLPTAQLPGGSASILQKT